MEELRVGPVAGERGRHISDRAAESCIRQVRLVQAMVQNAFPFLGPMGCPHASDQVGQVLITRVAQMTSPSTSHHLIRIQHLHLNSYSCTYHTHHPVYNLGSRILAELELNLATKEENLIMGLFCLQRPGPTNWGFPGDCCPHRPPRPHGESDGDHLKDETGSIPQPGEHFAWPARKGMTSPVKITGYLGYLPHPCSEPLDQGSQRENKYRKGADRLRL